MARETFPHEGSRLVFYDDGQFGSPLRGAPGVQFVVYTDDAATTEADITDMADVAIADSTITTDSDSLLPDFKGPDDDSTVLYLQQINPTPNSKIVKIIAQSEGAGSHPDLAAHDTLGLATQVTHTTRWRGLGNIAITNTSGAWYDLEWQNGGVRTKPLDVVIPNVQAGQFVEFEPDLLLDAGAGNVYFRWATVVDGVAVNVGVPASSGVSKWSAITAFPAQVGGAVSVPITAADIEHGAVRIRMQYRATGTRTVYDVISVWAARMRASGPFSRRVTDTLLVFDGQSLNNVPNPNMPVLVADDLGLPLISVGVSGASWTDLADTAEYRLHPIASEFVDPILVMTGGTHDIANSADNDSGAQALADMEGYADEARAAGFTRIVASTVTPSDYFDTDDETQVGIFNTGILASDHWDAVADLAANPDLDDGSDATYYADGTHWTATGAATAAVDVVAAIETLL